MKPRIYTYKITFEGTKFFYFGSKKEKYFGEEYYGSPKTNKWYWSFYLPKKQILEFFEYAEFSPTVFSESAFSIPEVS